MVRASELGVSGRATTISYNLVHAFHIPESPVLSASDSSFVFMTEQLFAKVRES
jgi:hypothetical protein